MKELIESNKTAEEIISSVTESSDVVDSAYFIQNAKDFLNDQTSSEDFPEEQYEALDWMITRVNQTHPSGDISKHDILNTMNHFSAPNVPYDKAEEALERFWLAVM